ncbi:adenosylcobinamide-GDP ribazoletransferase, partial [Oceaniglobus roseus]|uniref:adenosylcobinamide-GDP ribazoletransferase n=1 Tax=Oceaniglobus roseus TaxID=1737570 RepID=UPI000C7F4D09
LGTGAALTGGLHEDGLADTVDGFWGGWTRERRLEIMADSRIGTYGVIALVLSLGLRWSALATLFAAGIGWGALIAAAALSRVPMAALSCALPPARPSGLSARVGRPAQSTVGLALLAALLLAIPCAGAPVLPAAVLIALAASGLARLALRRIGGQTGDVLGAAQQLAETTALIVFAAAAAQGPS